MIVSMKKVTLIALQKDKNLALNSLADAEVMHIVDGNSEKVKTESSKMHEQLLAHKEAYSKLAILSDSLKSLVKPSVKEDISQLNSHDYEVKAEGMFNRIRDLNDKILEKNREIDRVKEWGNFDPRGLAELYELPFAVLIAALSKDQLKKVRQVAKTNSKEARSYDFLQLSKGKDHSLILFIAAKEENLPDFPKAVLPVESLASMQNDIRRYREEIEKIEQELKIFAKKSLVLKGALSDLAEQIVYEENYLKISDHEQFSIINGYVPVPELEKFKECAVKNQWAAVYEDIAETEEAINATPTLTSQRGLGKLGNVILQMFEMVPGYREFDITFVLLFAFSIFYAMIVGDAAYAMIFFAIGIFFVIKGVAKGAKIGAGILLWLWLSVFGMVWGAMNGAWFGMDAFKEKAPFNLFMVDWFADGNHVIYLSFVIGLCHLVFAHLWAWVRALKNNFWGSFAELGSIFMLIGFFHLVCMLILNTTPLPSYTLPSLAIGFGLLLLFGQQAKGLNVFKGIALGVQNAFSTVLGSIGNFSDIISYIRLYAVGLSGASIAVAFNSIAFSIPEPLSIVVTPIILIAAHGLNITLALLGIVVHALRLNTLEFSGHLGVQWSGYQYKPFMAKNKLVKGE